MSVIIRLQNLPWSANAMDIRSFFRGLSIPEGGVHIVGGEQGDAFIAFSTDEDARQAMMNDGGKIKEIQVKLLLSSRSEMHKVIEAARQNVPMVQLPQQVVPVQTTGLPSSVTGLLVQNIKIPTNLSEGFLSVPSEVPGDVLIDSKVGERKSTRSRSKSKDRDRSRGKDKKDKRERSRSRDRSRDRDRRRRDRSRSRDRRDRNNDRKRRDRDRSKEKIESRFPRKDDKKTNASVQDVNQTPPVFNSAKVKEGLLGDFPGGSRPEYVSHPGAGNVSNPGVGKPQFANNRVLPTPWAADMIPMNNHILSSMGNMNQDIRPKMPRVSRFSDANPDFEQMHRIQELEGRRNPNAFQQINDGLAPFVNVAMAPHVPFQEANFGAHVRMPFQGNPEVNNHRSRFSTPSVQGQCVKIQNLHPVTRYGEIRRFFTGNFISNQGLKMINDDNGKRSGTAYVRFFKPEGKQNALLRTGEFLNGKQLHISDLDDEEFENAIDSYRPYKDSDESGGENFSQHESVLDLDDDKDAQIEFKVLVLEDIPAFAKEFDIMKMFSDYSLLSIIIVVTKEVRKQYVAYVQFVNAEDAKAALDNKSKHLIGHKVIKVSPCCEEEFERIKAEQNGADLNDTEREEMSQVPRDPRQRRFEDPTVFNKLKPFPAPHVPVPVPVPVPTPRFPWRANPPLNPTLPRRFDREHGANGVRWGQVGNDFIKLDCVFLKGLPLRTTDRDILDFFSDVGVIPTKIHLMLTIQGQPSGDCFCEFIDPEEAQTAETKHGSLLGNNVISVELVSKKVVDEARGVIPPENGSRGGFRGIRGFPIRGGRRMRGMPGPFHGGTRGALNTFAPPNETRFGAEGGIEGFGMPGCVLSLENVPFRAEMDEILQFFHEFNLTPNDVIRRFNDKGHPTGDVRVCLRSPVDAQKAVQQLNKQYIRDRPISITML